MKRKDKKLFIGLFVGGLIIVALMVIFMPKKELEIAPLPEGSKSVTNLEKTTLSPPSVSEIAEFPGVDLPKQSLSKPETSETEIDKKVIEENSLAKLKRLTAAWAYTNYTKIGDQVQGTIKDQKMPDGDTHTVFPGMELMGIKIVALSEDEAVVGIENATRSIKRVAIAWSGKEKANPQPLSPEDEQKARELYEKTYKETFEKMMAEKGIEPIKPPTKEEQEAAKQFYMEHYYPKFMEMMKHYTPRPGEILPVKPSSQEELDRAKLEYFEKYGNRPQNINPHQ